MYGELPPAFRFPAAIIVDIEGSNVIRGTGTHCFGVHALIPYYFKDKPGNHIHAHFWVEG